MKTPPARSRLLAPLTLGAAVLASFTASASAQTVAEDFEDGALSPLWVEVGNGNIAEIITPSGFNARAGTKVHRLKWFEDNYVGTRLTRGVEGTSSNSPRITADGWYGFSFYLPADFPTPGKQMHIAQIHAWHSSLPATNSMIGVFITSDGRLTIDGGYGVGDGGKVATGDGVLSKTLTKGTWHDVIVYCKLSKIDTGILRAWVDGAPESQPTVNITNINLGNGAWSGDELMTHGAYIKWGLYCWDTGHYTDHESREIFFDEIKYQVGNPTGAFDLVKPAGYGAGYLNPQLGTAVMSETFNSMTSGPAPSGMTITGGAGTSAAVVDVPSVADKSVQLTDSSTSAHIEATKTFTAQTGRVLARWKFMFDSAADGHTATLLSGSIPAIEISTKAGKLVYRDGSGVEQILQSALPLIWYTVIAEINPATLKADIYVNGSRKLTGGTFRNPVSSLDRIRFSTSDPTAASSFFFNDISVSQPVAILSEIFDEMGYDSIPRYWPVTAAADTSALIRRTPSITDRSLQLSDTNATGKVEVWRSFLGQRDAFTAEWSFMQSVAADGHRMALNYGEADTALELVTSGGKLMYRNANGSLANVQSISPNTWYDVKVVVRPTTAQADVYVNNVLRLSIVGLRSSLKMVDRIVFGTSDALAGSDLYINNVYVNASPVPSPALLAAGIPRKPIVLKLDDLSTGGGNVPNTWRRVTNFTEYRQLKVSIGLIAKSLEVGTPSYLSYITGLRAAGRVEFWFHGYDHVGQEFNGKTYADQKNRFVTSQSLAQTKLGFKFKAFGAPENTFDATTVQVMSEDADITTWIYGNTATPGGKTVLVRPSGINLEWTTFIPNLEKLISGYNAQYNNYDYFVLQGHPGNWTDERWVEFVRIVDWLTANGFTIVTADELAASL